MVKDYSNVPCEKEIKNESDYDVMFELRGIPVIILAGETLKVEARTSEDLAIISHKIKELEIAKEDEGGDEPSLDLIENYGTYHFKFKEVLDNELFYKSNPSQEEIDEIMATVRAMPLITTAWDSEGALSSGNISIGQIGDNLGYAVVDDETGENIVVFLTEYDIERYTETGTQGLEHAGWYKKVVWNFEKTTAPEITFTPSHIINIDNMGTETKVGSFDMADYGWLFETANTKKSPKHYSFTLETYKYKEEDGTAIWDTPSIIRTVDLRSEDNDDLITFYDYEEEQGLTSFDFTFTYNKNLGLCELNIETVDGYTIAACDPEIPGIRDEAGMITNRILAEQCEGKTYKVAMGDIN